MIITTKMQVFAKVSLIIFVFMTELTVAKWGSWSECNNHGFQRREQCCINGKCKGPSVHTRRCVTAAGIAVQKSKTIELNEKYKGLESRVISNSESINVQSINITELTENFEQLSERITVNGERDDSAFANITENLERKDKEIKELTIKLIDSEQQVSNLVEKNKILEIEVQRLESLEARMDEADTRFQRKMEKLDATIKGLCGGVAYGGYCYTAILLTNNNYMNYDKAVKTCRALSSKPADIFDETHYNLLLKYIRSLTTASYRLLWLGMTINPSTKDINFSNGNQASYVKYLPSYPRSIATFTQMNLQVNQDPNSIYQGMVNNEKTILFHGVLCQK